jgi:UDP-N-acetylenolpyruvoylglucosamine reductase
MTTARTSLEHHTSAAGHPDQATLHHHRASKLFEKDHAYAARLVQLAATIRTVVRSTTTMKLGDRVPAEIERDDRITASIVAQPRAHGSDL